MTGSEALVYFTLELARASSQLGIEPPKVTAITVTERNRMADPTVLAYLEALPNGFEPELRVMWHLLWSGNKNLLRCVARHEATHILLGHATGTRTQQQREFNEALIDIVTKARWNEPAQCGLR